MIVSCPSSPGILRRPSRRARPSRVHAPVYDSNGNATTDDSGNTLVWDAWNRLVEVKNSSGFLLKAYTYDGFGRRVTETDGYQDQSTKLYSFRARWYSFDLHWISGEPSGGWYIDGMNLYLSMAANPINSLDWSGLRVVARGPEYTLPDETGFDAWVVKDDSYWTEHSSISAKFEVAEYSDANVEVQISAKSGFALFGNGAEISVSGSYKHGAQVKAGMSLDQKYSMTPLAGKCGSRDPQTNESGRIVLVLKFGDLWRKM